MTLLLERDAKFLPDAEGLFPQHLVARSSQTADLLLLLRQHGADLDQKDNLYQWTPLFHAASEGRVECLAALLEYGADADTLDEKGLTATYYATWEGHLSCVDLLWERQRRKVVERAGSARLGPSAPQASLNSTGAMELTPPGIHSEPDGIPDLSLPPPIIPLRRYGHNFLDTKCFVAINFDRGAKAIQFFNEARYPAARITISSKTCDLIPRNIILPIQEDTRSVLFQVDNLSTFTVDFEIFPTFGSKVIAKSVALPDTFSARDSSSGTCCLPMFDPRLRAVGQIHFNFQVIKPYSGRPLEITQFATYWKATSALDESGLITGSSLSGDYLRLCVQLTRDAFPVIYPSYTFDHSGLDVSIGSLPFRALPLLSSDTAALRSASETTNIVDLRAHLSSSILALRSVLAALPASINLNLHVLYPTSGEQQNSGVYNSIDMNAFADAILTDVFDHARALRAQSTELTRSIVFTSWNPHICTALNWKQPNFPVLLCNGLGSRPVHEEDAHGLSIKESVQLAQSNNFMGITCSARMLTMVPALIETIKQAGLVLVSDGSSEEAEQSSATAPRPVLPEGVNGIMKASGVLRFNESVDM